RQIFFEADGVHAQREVLGSQGISNQLLDPLLLFTHGGLTSQRRRCKPRAPSKVARSFEPRPVRTPRLATHSQKVPTNPGGVASMWSSATSACLLGEQGLQASGDQPRAFL